MNRLKPSHCLQDTAGESYPFAAEAIAKLKGRLARKRPVDPEARMGAHT